MDSPDTMPNAIPRNAPPAMRNATRTPIMRRVGPSMAPMPLLSHRRQMAEIPPHASRATAHRQQTREASGNSALATVDANPGSKPSSLTKKLSANEPIATSAARRADTATHQPAQV